MIHPVPFESNPKNDPPPHPGEDQSTKRVKLLESSSHDSDMVENHSPVIDLATLSPEPYVPVSLATDPVPLAAESVPETQMTNDLPPAQDVQMADSNTVSSTKTPSFKDKLLNSDPNNGDVAIDFNGNIPTVNFADHVIETLNKKMGLAVVIKLLGRKIGYRQLRNQLHNLWKPTGHLKLTDLDEDCFLVRFQDDMDYQNALLTGPWMIYGHYLTV
ncbi:hypothetical protein K1719_012065 [Acacia pycnantha]|nr:hypothetical protein K1719_012065 [Acacia pycnantha]